ncbi:hypothetical protein DSO57_1007596 [Entomophthora muscae]|uniref:Uncharacterized protein n=1 Tax=Entomophthora muscae TaxID=34485 RepID=A0ACC2RYL2_9FUNG|nr:hypothetical protein DSO57_1007596 [Entomophthora muscae]
MSTHAQDQTSGNTVLVNSPTEASKEKEAVFRSPQDFFPCKIQRRGNLGGAQDKIPSLIQFSEILISPKVDDFEQKLQVLELAIEEANVVFGEPYKAQDSEQLTDSEDTLAGSAIQ